MSDKFSEIDIILGNIFPPTLEEIFDQKLKELGMKRTTAQEALGIGYRPLKRILSGTEKTVDFTLLFRLASFLDMEKEAVVKLYMESLERNIGTPTIPDHKIRFIKEHFDLQALRKAGLIESVRDFGVIEERINKRLGLNSIFEYQRPTSDIAFSSGMFKPENHRTRAFWIQSAIASLQQIGNPNEYNREQLVKNFPRIRLHSINEENGLIDVIRLLYKVGVTVIFQPSLPTLQLRGATLVLDNKPCVVLTDYRGFYPTLWFALVHELYHVLFDLDEIAQSKYHMTDDSNDQSSVLERERMADEFAREYLLPKSKMEYLWDRVDDQSFVYRFAIDNHIHPSIVYAIIAYLAPEGEREKSWKICRASYSDHIFKKLLNTVSINWNDADDIETAYQNRLSMFYNH